MNRLKKGRLGEYFVILQVIEKGFAIYPSLVSDRGLDVGVSEFLKRLIAKGEPEWLKASSHLT